MLDFTLRYCVPIDAITVDRSLKLHKHELYNDDWVIVHKLVDVLAVGHLIVSLYPV